MNSLVNAIKNTVPITQFNRGLAGKIFEDVKKQGAKVVMKNNTPECVLMSPEEYLTHANIRACRVATLKMQRKNLLK